MNLQSLLNEAIKCVKRHRVWAGIGCVALVAIAALVLPNFLARSHHGKATVPTDEPAEFLYLDGGRVLAYLAQFDGGNFTSEELTSKVSETKSGKIAVQNALELGEESQQEQSLSREITPTAAGNFVELLGKLEAHRGLEKIGLGRFKREVHELPEGQFVTFRTHALSPPVYLNPYLAVRERRTLSTLFPMPPEGDPSRQRVEQELDGARRFRKQVGKDPRVVFALRPVNKREREDREATLDGGTEATEQASRSKAEKAAEQQEEENHVEYLMPMDAHLITEERSLIKFGGGEFTVVGKLVRSFPEDGDVHHPAYVDSPTLETWAQPLARAPLALLCRTDPKCVTKIRSKSGRRKEAIEDSRAWALEALTEQTEIAKRGAVIVPIAIYK